MTQHQHPNVTLVREGFDALQRGDTAWMDQHLADDVMWHVGGVPATTTTWWRWARPRPPRRQGHRAAVDPFLDALPG